LYIKKTTKSEENKMVKLVIVALVLASVTGSAAATTTKTDALVSSVTISQSAGLGA
jgi:hypothetical protein